MREGGGEGERVEVREGGGEGERVEVREGGGTHYVSHYIEALLMEILHI